MALAYPRTSSSEPGPGQDGAIELRESKISSVTRQGEIYDFAKTVLNETEFCGGCFSPDGETFFVHQQGDAWTRDPDAAPETAALTYAIWGPFDRGRP